MVAARLFLTLPLFATLSHSFVVTSPLKPKALAKKHLDNLAPLHETKKNSGVEPAVRSKLLAESIAPWRTIRLFLYASLGSGALLGGFITLSGVAAALSGARSDVDLNTEYTNLAIDFGAAIGLAVLGKLDFDKGQELNENVVKKMERKKENKKMFAAMAQREQQLSSLQIKIVVSDDGKTQTSPIVAVQDGAEQNVVLVAGSRQSCRDALVSASFEAIDFSSRNVLIVPYVTGDEEQFAETGGFGGEKPKFASKSYVADPVGVGWEEYIEAEMEDAVKQNGEKARVEGIVIVMSYDGKIIRRGLGEIPWESVVNQLKNKVRALKDKTDDPSIF